MPRGIVVLVVLAVLIALAIWFLAGRAEEVPTRQIEIDVNAPANAS